MDRNLALEIVRVTEAAALSSARWMGKGNAQAADEAAIRAMHHTLQTIPFRGKIVLGEGDEGIAELLYAGESVGSGTSDELDVALDALECTRSVAFGRSNAMAAIALAPRGDLLVPPDVYMEKIAVSAEAAEVIDLDASVEENLNRIAEAKKYSVNDLTVVILERERHANLIAQVRKVGSRIHLIPDGDVAAAIAAALPGSGIDVLIGSGSASGGVLAAAAMRCIGGELLGRLISPNFGATSNVKYIEPFESKRVYRARDMARGNNIMFAATGVTDGDMLNGVRYRIDGATTHSLVLRSQTRTRRFIVTEHYFDDHPKY